MNLKWYLITRIWLLALLCLALAIGHALWETKREQQRNLVATLDAVAKQVKNRLTVTSMGFSPTGFDSAGRFSFWEPLLASSITAGVCVRYVDEQGNVLTNTCRNGSKAYRDQGWEVSAPGWYAGLHRLLLRPGREVAMPLTWNGEQHGQVIAGLDARTEITETWQRIDDLIGLAVTIVVALCLLVYFVVSHALRPTREILSGLQRLEQGELGTRLPRFRLRELQKMSDGFNRLASSLEKSLTRQSELARRLVDAQEQERHYVARELHDEFGQCLSAINAIAASVSQTAAQEKSALVKEGENLGRIAEHMMQALRDILNRLRPVGIEELGLLGGIRGLVAEHGARGTHVELAAEGNFDDLPEAVVVSVYRVVQECLTNVAKHSNATTVQIRIERARDPATGPGESITVSVEDDGNATQEALSQSTGGRGLLGMRERVTALGGQLLLKAREAGGLNVQARIPIEAVA